MKRKVGLTLLAAATSMTLALTACSGGSGTSGGGTDAGDEPKTLVIWDYENDESAMGQAWAKAVEIFKEEHPDVTVTEEAQSFEQIQKNAKIVLTGDSVPDVMEYNKGNATAGQLAAQGLIMPLTDAASEYGWDTKLAGSLATTAMYSEQGLMGSGDWYGVPNYGEFVGVYYNKTMFEEAGVEVPTTLAEFEDVMATFKDNGVTPLAEAGAEYPLGQLWYELVLANSERSFVDSYQLFANDVDFHGSQMTDGTTKLQEWIDAGYIDNKIAALTAEDMGVSFLNGKYPMMVSGSWWFGRLDTEMQDDWGMFLFPGNSLHPGSSGNLWVIPTNAKSPTLAKEFIDITLRPEVQNVFAEKGGLPVAGDTSAITDDQVKELTTNFQTILDSDGLAFYPDWPVPGYYDVLVSQLQSLANGNKDVTAVLDGLQDPYVSGKDDLLNG
ncbi:MAG: ABC transporter substrate-binding protein [Demequina sp.]|uniref:ABC transporter substrate-binding protein n=1 Tax=Demequina sp. TaxID=2050685 RepID=UPI003A874400